MWKHGKAHSRSIGATAPSPSLDEIVAITARAEGRRPRRRRGFRTGGDTQLAEQVTPTHVSTWRPARIAPGEAQ
jgi:hypothetical protein